MKKNLLFGMSAAIGMLLATSCSNEEQFAPSGGEAQVTFSLGLESGMNTRAISDGTGINQLYYAIFDSEGKVVKSCENEEVDFPLQESISLVKGQEYTAVFWAWDDDCKAYTVGEDKKTVTINYDEALNNDETRDAFFRSETFKVSEDVNVEIVLKRAFAQLNVGISEDEYATAVDQGVTITTSEVEIKQAATTLNLIDGSVGNPKDITFKANAIPADTYKETLKVDVDCDGDLDEFKYLSMCYFLANDGYDGASKTTLKDLKFTFSSADGKNSFILNQGLGNAPVQRNYRTNILSFGGNGGLLTGNVTVKVLLDPLYDGEHTLTNENVWEEYAGIYTEEALAGKTIMIPEGWHIRNGWILEPMPEYWKDPNNKLYNSIDDTPVKYELSYTIDGQGNTVTFEPYDYKFAVKNVFAAANGKEVTVKNIKFAGEHLGIYGGVYGDNNYTNLFENTEIVGNGIYYYNKVGDIPMSAFSNLGTTTLKNCTITGTYWVGDQKDANVENALIAKERFGDVYDVFVPNDGITDINSCTVGRAYIHNHGKLTVSGTSKVNEIVSNPLVNGSLTINEGAQVTSVDINQYSDKFPPKVKIVSGASVGTLQLNSINKENISIDDAATVGKIIWKGTEYTSIADFKAAL